jgi:D-sedoheptulose 7-phosphate isomerase
MGTIETIDSYLNSSIEAINSIRSQSSVISSLASAMIDVLTNEGTIFWAGNGGSAADSQHLAAELVGRFEKDRQQHW